MGHLSPRDPFLSASHPLPNGLTCQIPKLSPIVSLTEYNRLYSDLSPNDNHCTDHGFMVSSDLSWVYEPEDGIWGSVVSSPVLNECIPSPVVASIIAPSNRTKSSSLVIISFTVVGTLLEKRFANSGDFTESINEEIFMTSSTPIMKPVFTVHLSLNVVSDSLALRTILVISWGSLKHALLTKYLAANVFLMSDHSSILLVGNRSNHPLADPLISVMHKLKLKCLGNFTWSIMSIVQPRASTDSCWSCGNPFHSYENCPEEKASKKEHVTETYDYRSQYDAYEYDTYHANYNIEMEDYTMY
ncbi:hypothetical protein Tco_0311678 [Tanacetum coccineum]